MSRRANARPRRAVLLAAAVVLCVSACGSDDDAHGGGSGESASVTVDTAPTAGADAPDDVLPAGDPSGLVVPLDYLQGEWCNTDGEAWVIDGETARFGENHDELIGELPVTLAFTGGSERVLISQTDDEFVLDLQVRQVTFTRGRC